MLFNICFYLLTAGFIYKSSQKAKCVFSTWIDVMNCSTDNHKLQPYCINPNYKRKWSVSFKRFVILY